MPKEPQGPILLTDDDATASPPALIRAGLDTLPAAISAACAGASERFIEFFTAYIRNRNTRFAYARAVKQFFDWTERHALGLADIEPLTVAAYIEQLGAEMAKPSVGSTWPPSGNSPTIWLPAESCPRTPPVRCADRSTW
jgi:hypothetical protein